MQRYTDGDVAVCSPFLGAVQQWLGGVLSGRPGYVEVLLSVV
jgi:hypothetical protein